MRQFGQWITAEAWEDIKEDDVPAEQVKEFERILTQKLDKYLPQKTTKIGIEDKPFMTSELKALKSRRMREYRKKGKSKKYLEIKTEYYEKYEKASEAFLRKNVDSLKEANPGKAHSILKKWGPCLENVKTAVASPYPHLSTCHPMRLLKKLQNTFQG